MIDPLRIAMVGPFGFAPKKTMRARAFRLATALVERGHAVQIAMPPWHTPDEGDRRWLENGVSCHYVPVSNPLAMTRALLTSTLAFQPNVVHCFKPKAYSGFVAEWLWRTRRNEMRIIMDSDDWEGWGGWNDREDYPRLAKHLFARQEQWGMTHCHQLTVASLELERLARQSGVQENQIVYLPNGPGIATARDEAAIATKRAELGVENRPTLLLYSRFFEFEIGRLVAVLQRVHAQLPDLAVLVVGASLDAEDGRAFQQQMTAAGLWSSVINLGWLDEADLPAVLASADVGLYLMDDNLLNRTKCPVKLVDMLALGVPVVGEAVGQVAAYINDDENGRLHPTGAIETLASSVVGLLENSADSKRLSAAAIASVQRNYTWSTVAERLEAAYAR